jgi:dipeptidase D
MLENLEPKPVWNYFENFCTIPHPSGHESQAAQFIIDCAAKLGLTAISDATGNVLIRKKATDSTKKETVILQSHLDMVPQKNAATLHDFKKDPLRPIIDGDWVKAQGTTLGADNGIGVAIALAILESKTIKHGPIEALFTIDEERGMTGAFGLAKDFITGRTLINLDTENEHELCIGCAGGTDIIAQIPIQFESSGNKHAIYQITINGLQGGHSGMEIHLGRGNALKLMCRLLLMLSDELDCRIVNFHGGSARNAIPREAFAVVAIPEQKADALKKTTEHVETLFINEYRGTDPNLRILLSEAGKSQPTIVPACSRRLLAAISECPNGIINMNSAVPGTVQTSNNCAIVNNNGTAFRIDCMLRSSLETDLFLYKKAITGIFERQGASVTYGSVYPGWQPVTDSKLLIAMTRAYTSVHRKPPEIVVVHAGLECGIIKEKFPGIDMISCGPTIKCAHSPDEQLHIASVERFWRCIVAGLEMIE